MLNIDDAINAVLEQPFWINTLDTESIYHRIDDDTNGTMDISFSHDGDGWIMIMNKVDPKEMSYSFRFRTPLFGGGESPRVRNALLILAEAIRRDNENNPQSRKPIV